MTDSETDQAFLVFQLRAVHELTSAPLSGLRVEVDGDGWPGLEVVSRPPDVIGIGRDGVRKHWKRPLRLRASLSGSWSQVARLRDSGAVRSAGEEQACPGSNAGGCAAAEAPGERPFEERAALTIDPSAPLPLRHEWTAEAASHCIEVHLRDELGMPYRGASVRLEATTGERRVQLTETPWSCVSSPVAQDGVYRTCPRLRVDRSMHPFVVRVDGVAIARRTIDESAAFTRHTFAVPRPETRER